MDNSICLRTITKLIGGSCKTGTGRICANIQYSAYHGYMNCRNRLLLMTEKKSQILKEATFKTNQKCHACTGVPNGKPIYGTHHSLWLTQLMTVNKITPSTFLPLSSRPPIKLWELPPIPIKVQAFSQNHLSWGPLNKKKSFSPFLIL